MYYICVSGKIFLRENVLECNLKIKEKYYVSYSRSIDIIDLHNISAITWRIVVIIYGIICLVTCYTIALICQYTADIFYNVFLISSI